MTDVIRRLATVWSAANSFFGPLSKSPLKYLPQGSPRILIVGVYMSEKRNLIEHLVSTISTSVHCVTTQRWISIGSVSKCDFVSDVTANEVHVRTPKFSLINRLITQDDIDFYDFIMVCDDDVTLCDDFIDRFIGWQQHCDLSLAQPARSWNSFVDHTFVRRSLWSKARETRFVEIGPIFCMSQAMARLLVPFDQSSAMGWGYDLVWPVTAKKHGLKLGIVDDASIEHTIRPRGALYQTGTELESMAAMLSQREHLQTREAFVVLNRFR